MPEINEPIIPTHEFPEEADMQAFRENPKEACEGMQKKYIGISYKDYQEPESFEGEIPEGFEIVEREYKNPFTNEVKTIKVLREIEKEPEPTPEEIIEEKKRELKIKLINGTITEEEKEMLKLLAI